MDYIEYALRFIGTKYTWGGNTKEQGLDCSGLVCEVLKANGSISNSKDYSSQQLFNLLISGKLDRDIPLVFYGKNEERVSHVAILYDQNFVIEAAGEGRLSTDKGSVRVRPVDYRADLIGVMK